MKILSQNKQILLNDNHVLCYERHGDYIQAHPSHGGSSIAMGFFNTRERTEEVFNELIQCAKDGVPFYEIPEE